LPCTYREAWLAASLLSQFVPNLCSAGHLRWGRTDTAVPESGAYLTAVILVVLFVLFLWFLFRAASNQSTVSQRGKPVPVQKQRARLITYRLSPSRRKLQTDYSANVKITVSEEG
jgi:hypothetical protein